MAKINTPEGFQDMLMRDIVGRRVRLRRDVQTSISKAREGTVCLVRNTHKGKVRLETAPCAHCGLSFFVRGVERGAYELLPEEP
jgi:hypothetical protein